MALLQVRGLIKRFAGRAAVNGLSFDIGEGRCVALLGPNGAGKTTTLQMLAGLLAPTEGTIRFPAVEAAVDIRSRIGYLPQYPAFYNWMSGREFIEYAGKLAHVPSGELKERTGELLGLVGLADAAKRRIGGYSGGMRQRLGIAQALIHRPKLLMLDEPVSALDPLGRREVLEMMRLIRKETTILFSTHVLHDAEEICDDVMIMHEGSIAEAGSLQEVRERYREPYITIEADEELALADWLDSLRETEAVKEHIVRTERSGRIARIFTMDIRTAKQPIFEALAASQVPVAKFEVAQTSLEDLFLKVVQVKG